MMDDRDLLLTDRRSDDAVPISSKNQLSIPVAKSVKSTIGVESKLAAPGAEEDAPEAQGWALHRAATQGKIEEMRKLLGSGVQVNCSDSDANWVPGKPNTPLTGATALHLAAQHGQLESVKYLCLAGASVDRKDRIGSTCLHRAVSEGHIEVTRLLIKKFAANVRAVNRIGNTPLHVAAYIGHLGLVNLLRESLNAEDIVTKNSIGMTPAEYAYQPDVKSLLKSASQ